MTDDWMNNDSVEKIYINSRSKLNFLGGYVTNLTTVLNLIFSLPNNSLNEIQNEVEWFQTKLIEMYDPYLYQWK